MTRPPRTLELADRAHRLSSKIHENAKGPPKDSAHDGDRIAEGITFVYTQHYQAPPTSLRANLTDAYHHQKEYLSNNQFPNGNEALILENCAYHAIRIRTTQALRAESDLLVYHDIVETRTQAQSAEIHAAAIRNGRDLDSELREQFTNMSNTRFQQLKDAVDNLLLRHPQAP